jgi:hypothetical protein
MGSVIRPVFTNGERLTAQRLNEIVEYLRTSLRRALLAPLSPGVAAGLELGGTPANGTPFTSAPPLNLPPALQISTIGPLLATPTLAAVSSVTVSPGVAIDGAARILVSTQTLSFSYADVAAQIHDLGVNDQILVSLGADSGTASPVPPACAPTTGRSTSEGVQLLFTRITGTGTTPSPVTPNFQATPFQAVPPWADPIDQGGPAVAYAVPLGSVTTQQDTTTQAYTLIPSQAQRIGMMPYVGGLRSSDGDVSVLVDRINGIPAVGVLVPTVFEPTAPAFFQTYAGGPYAQAAVVAADLGMPAAARPTPGTPYVFEVAGGNNGLPQGGAVGLPGTSGVVAVSMQYDTTTAGATYTTYGGFPAVLQSGFPLVLSPNATSQPMVTPPIPPSKTTAGNLTYIGLSAAPSHADPTDPTGLRQLVPVAMSGIVMAYVFVGAATQSTGTIAPTTIPVGTLLTPASMPNGAALPQWGLVPISSRSAAGAVTVAQLATPVSNSATTGSALVPAWVWVVPPYNVPATTGTVVAAGIVPVALLDANNNLITPTPYPSTPSPLGNLKAYGYNPSASTAGQTNGSVWIVFDGYTPPSTSSYTYVVKAMIVEPQLAQQQQQPGTPVLSTNKEGLATMFSVAFDSFQANGIVLTVMEIDQADDENDAEPPYPANWLEVYEEVIFGPVYLQVEITRYPN